MLRNISFKYQLQDKELTKYVFVIRLWKNAIIRRIIIWKIKM